MPNLSPKATALINKYDAGDLAEQVVELEEQLRLCNIDQFNAEAANAAQAQTIKAAHIRTAEISTRYNDCQREVNGLVRYVRALRDFDYAPSAIIPLKLIEAYQDLSDETRKAIESES